MKKRILLLACLCLCAAMLASCADLLQPMNALAASSKLDKIEQDCLKKGYDVARVSESEMNSVIESIVSEEGIMLEGPAVGMLTYSYEEQDAFIMATVIATSSAKDAKTLSGAMRNMTDAALSESLTVEISQSGLIVTMLQIYG